MPGAGSIDLDRQVGEVRGVDLRRRLGRRARRGEAQRREPVPRGRRPFAGEPVHQDAVAVAGEQERGEEEIGQLLVGYRRRRASRGRARPRRAVGEPRAGGADEAGQLLRGLAADSAGAGGTRRAAPARPHRRGSSPSPPRPRPSAAGATGSGPGRRCAGPRRRDGARRLACCRPVRPCAWDDLSRHRRARSARSTGRPRAAPPRPRP